VIDRQWLDQPAVTRISAASAAALRPFNASYNPARPFTEQVKPYNFLICVHVYPFSHLAGYPPQRFQLVAPYDPDPRSWLELDWTDIYSGHVFRIHNSGPPSPDSVKVKTNRDVFDRYRTHPEPKSLDPAFEPCGRLSRGLLQRRPVTATEISYIGKESNRLEDTAAGLIHDADEILNTHSDPALDPWRTLVTPVLRDFNTADIADRARLDRRTIQRLLSGRGLPRPKHRAALTALAATLAQVSLEARGIDPPREPLAVLRLYRDAASTPPTCAVCGAKLASRRARYCGTACKKHAYRQRVAFSATVDPAPAAGWGPPRPGRAGRRPG
jgi:hypothetical protein